MEPLSLTYRNSRVNRYGKPHSANHNCRSFKSEYALHIDPERSKYNYYYLVEEDHSGLVQLPEDFTFREHEIAAYTSHFSPMLEARNQMYKRNGHPERILSMEGYYTDSKKTPEETIIQVGSKGDLDLAYCQKPFMNAVFSFIMEHQRMWPGIIILDVAIHVDEASLHCHMRKMFTAKNDDGNEEENEVRCLVAAGFTRPDPTKKRTRYNSEKITYTEAARNLMVECLRKYKFRIKEPERRGRYHLECEEYRQKAEAERLRKEREELDKMESENDLMRDEIERKRSDVNRMMLEADRKKAKAERMKFEADKDLQEAEKARSKATLANLLLKAKDEAESEKLRRFLSCICIDGKSGMEAFYDWERNNRLMKKKKHKKDIGPR